MSWPSPATSTGAVIGGADRRHTRGVERLPGKRGLAIGGSMLVATSCLSLAARHRCVGDVRWGRYRCP